MGRLQSPGVTSADGTWQGNPIEVVKADDDRRQVFGWASVAFTADGEQVVDSHGDVIDEVELEAAAYDFLRSGGWSGDEHSDQTPFSLVIESVVMTRDKQAAMGIADGTMPVGWWIGVQITDADLWEKIRAGARPAFSIQGTAWREDVEDD